MGAGLKALRFGLWVVEELGLRVYLENPKPTCLQVMNLGCSPSYEQSIIGIIFRTVSIGDNMTCYHDKDPYRVFR